MFELNLKYTPNMKKKDYIIAASFALFLLITYPIDSNIYFNIVWWILTVFLLFLLLGFLMSLYDIILHSRGKGENEKKYSLLKEKIKNELKISADDSIGVLANIADYRLMIESNREVIQAIEKEYSRPFMHNLVKLSSFLEDNQANIIENSKMIFDDYYYVLELRKCRKAEKGDGVYVEKHKKIAYENGYVNLINNIKSLELQVNIFNQLFLYGINMITALLDKNTLVFYELYDKLDRFEVFNSEWQNKQGSLLNVVSSELSLMRNEQREGLEKLNNGLSTLNTSVKSMEKSMTKQLKKINSKLDYNNLLSTVNTVQLSEIRKKI